MPDLHFEVVAAAAMPHAVAPCIGFRVRIRNGVAQEAVHSIALRCQVQIDPARRRYQPEEQEKLRDLFGEPERWSQTVHPLIWDQVSFNAPGFTGTTDLDLPVTCSFDFDVAITKYLHGLQQGEVAVALLFSGTVFYAGAAGLQVAQIPWDREARWRLPVKVWQEMMDLYYPNTAWLCLPRATVERLQSFRSERGLISWEQALERLLDTAVAERSA